MLNRTIFSFFYTLSSENYMVCPKTNNYHWKSSGFNYVYCDPKPNYSVVLLHILYTLDLLLLTLCKVKWRYWPTTFDLPWFKRKNSLPLNLPMMSYLRIKYFSRHKNVVNKVIFLRIKLCRMFAFINLKRKVFKWDVSKY